MNIAAGYLLAALLGAAVGAVEVMQRYRSEPFRALWNPWGTAYAAFNALVAVAAFYVVVRAEGLATKPELELLTWSAAAGFGSAALLRAKVMNVRLADGKELALGPELLVQTFLSVLDRELDRYRARKRFSTVRKLFERVDFEKAKLRLPMEVFQAMQTVTEEESNRLMERVNEVDGMQTIEARDKSFQLGYYLLDLVGEEFLTDVLTRYGDDFERAPAPQPPGLPLSKPQPQEPSDEPPPEPIG